MSDLLKALHELLGAILNLWPLGAAISVAAIAVTLYARSRKQILFESWVNMTESTHVDLGKSVADLLLFKIGHIKRVHERSVRAIGSWNMYQDVPAFRQGLDEDVKLLASVELGKYASIISSFLMILFRLIPMVFKPARMRGSIHQYGEQLHLLASLEAYGRNSKHKRTNYVWEVIQNKTLPERLPEAVDELAYKIFIDLTQEDVFKSWQSFKAYTDGLSSYIAYVDLNWKTDYEKARECYKRGLKREPQSAALQYNLGVLEYYLFVESANGEAIWRFKEALNHSTHPRLSAHAHSGLANALLQRYARFNIREPQLLQDALSHAKQAYDIDPSLDGANKALAFAYHQLSESSDQSGNRAGLEQAKENRDLAIKYYRRAYQLNPRNYIAHNNLGNLYLEWAGRYERANPLEFNKWLTDAARELELCLGINPQYKHAYDNLGNVFRERGEFDRALDSYWTAVRASDSYPEAMNDIATLYLERSFKKHDSAIALSYHLNALAMLQSEAKSKSEHKLENLHQPTRLCGAFIKRWKVNGLGYPDDSMTRTSQETEDSPCSCLHQISLGASNEQVGCAVP
jgi:tetratricopeptide (TPR) repeat protein